MSAGIPLRDRWREKENAGEIPAASDAGFDEWDEVPVIASDDDPLLGGRAFQDLRVAGAPLADRAGVNRVHTALPQLIARPSMNVHVEEESHRASSARALFQEPRDTIVLVDHCVDPLGKTAVIG
jgi:hypothetical protein